MSKNNKKKSIWNEMERIVIRHRTGSKAKQTEDFSLADFKEITFGRGSSVEVKYALRDYLVSRQHARITRDGDNPGQFLLIDLKSRNGTFVNKSRISSPCRLHHGDLVQFGPSGPVFVFELDPPLTNSTKQTRMNSDTGAGQATREIPPVTRDIHNTGFTLDAQQPCSQTRMANDGGRPTSLANTHSDVFRPTSQAELDDLTGGQSNTNLLSTWQRHQPRIIVVCMLLVTASVIISLLLQQHDVPIAPIALVPKTSTLPQPSNKTDIKAMPDTVRTEKPVRGLVVEPALAPEQISVPNKGETSTVTILDSVGNQSVEKVAIGASSMHKTRKKVKTHSSQPADERKKVEIGTSSMHKTRKKVKTHSSQPADERKKVEIGTSSMQKTRKKVKTHSSKPADDWKVIEHQ
jgi:pSer/pThr/pTyr-binding forkhead associated (FHA) protein